jgi:hypothetical protein
MAFKSLRSDKIYHLFTFKIRVIAWRWWLMPVILAIKEGRDQEDHSSKPALGK